MQSPLKVQETHEEKVTLRMTAIIANPITYISNRLFWNFCVVSSMLSKLILKFPLTHLPRKFRYKCYSCEPPDCLEEQEPTINTSHMCQNAVHCWKSRVRDAFGVERVSRGCTSTHEQLPVYCMQQNNNNKDGNNANDRPQKRHTSGQYNIECCTGDYCNDGDFPELPPIVYSE